MKERRSRRHFPASAGLALLLSLILLLSGCAGNKPAESAAGAAPAESAAESVTAAESEAAGETAAAAEAESAAESEAETKVEAAAAEAESAPETEAESEAPAAADAKTADSAAAQVIENNGGNFVRFGDRIYFRVYGQDAMPETALWGNFMQPVTDGMSEIRYLDLKDGQIRKLIDDRGFGGIWVFEDKLWMNRMTEYGNVIYCLDPADPNAKPADIDWGTLLGISGDGSHLVYENHNADARQQFVVRGPEPMQRSVYAEADEVLMYCGAVGRSIFVLSCNYGGDTPAYEMWELYSQEGDEEAKLIKLGVLPESEFNSAPMPVQFLEAGDKVYLSFEYREGTGHFYAGSLYCEAIDGQADSLKDITGDTQAVRDEIQTAIDQKQQGGDLMTDPETLKMYLAGDGSLKFAMYLPGEVAVTLGESRDLVLFEDSDARTEADGRVIYKNWLPSSYENQNEEDPVIFPQAMEYVGGKVFTVCAEAERAPEEDIGWRCAYRRLQLEYLYYELEDTGDTDTKNERHIENVPLKGRRLLPEEVALLPSLPQEYNGFALSVYNDPTEIDWREVCYNGAGIDTMLTRRQQDALLKATGETELYTDVTAIRKADLEEFVRKTTGTSYADAARPLDGSWTYLPEDDLYCFQHGDTNWQPITFISGWDLGDGIYRLSYTASLQEKDRNEWPCLMTVRISDGQWQFLSNQPQ